MTTRDLLVFSTAFFSATSSAQDEWRIALGNSDAQDVRDVVPTTDGGCYVMGRASQSIPFGFITRLDPNGNEVWSKRVKKARFSGAITTEDGGLIATGTATPANFSEILTCRFGPDGDCHWCYMATGGYNDIGYRVALTEDKGYLVGGVHAVANNHERVALLKLDSLGALQWSRTYDAFENGQTFGVQVAAVLPLKNGGYMIAGRGPFDGNPYPMDDFLLKVDSSGGVVWMKRYITPLHDLAHEAIQTSDGGSILCGRIQGGFPSPGNSDENGFLLKTNDLGDIEWATQFGTTSQNDGLMSISKVASSGFVVTGYTRSYGDNCDLILIECDSVGAPLWASRSTMARNEFGYSIRVSPSGNCFLAGDEYYGTQSSFPDGMVIRTATLPPTCFWEVCDPNFSPLAMEVMPLSPAVSTFDQSLPFIPVIADNMVVAPVCPFITTAEDVQEPLEATITPNPASSTATISLHPADASPATARLLDATGRTRLYANGPSAGVALDLRQLTSGIYIVMISNSAERSIVRLIKE